MLSIAGPQIYEYFKCGSFGLNFNSYLILVLSAEVNFKMLAAQLHPDFIVVIMLFLYEVLSPKDLSIKASPQTWRYFNLGSQVGLRHMMSNWERVQMSTVGQWNISSPISLAYPYFWIELVLSRAAISRTSPPPDMLTGIATMLIGLYHKPIQ